MNSINVHILFFGPLKTYFGNKVNLSLPNETLIKVLVTRLKEVSPEASSLLDSCKIAVNSIIENDDFQLVDSCEVAILPPFSGG